MASRLGHDFGHVRVHADARSDESTRAVGAAAYTVGNHVALRNRPYRLTSGRDRYLLAHELAHVAQQGSGTRGSPTALGRLDDPLERDADAAATMVARGDTTTVGTRSPAGVVRRAPTGIELAEEKQFGHADLKTDELKQKWRTYLGATTLLKATPVADYSGHCTKEYLTEIANTCPAKRFEEIRGEGSFCTGDKCLEFNKHGSSGDASTGKMVTDGPSTFTDLHRTRNPQSLLEGTGVKACSVVCHQLYKFDRKDTLGAFYVIRNFRAGSYTPPGTKTPLHITTGEVRKVPAPSAVPSAEDFAKKIAPDLKSKGVLADAPPAPKDAPAPKEDKGK